MKILFWFLITGCFSMSIASHASLQATWNLKVIDQESQLVELQETFIATKNEEGKTSDLSSGIWTLPGDILKGRIFAHAIEIEQKSAVLQLSIFDTSYLTMNSPRYRSQIILELPLKVGQKTVMAFTLGDTTRAATEFSRKRGTLTLELVEGTNKKKH